MQTSLLQSALKGLNLGTLSSAINPREGHNLALPFLLAILHDRGSVFLNWNNNT
ncbi:MAG: hypothetical protein ABSE96_15860 [Terracidiphilus sp.]